MRIDQKILGRFRELLDEGTSVMRTRTPVTGGFPHPYRHGMVRGESSDEKVSPELATAWGLRCLNLLKRVVGVESDFYQTFKEQASGFECFSNYSYVALGMSILEAVKTEYEKGYLLDTRVLIQAEVFDDFLEQASHLLEKGYYGPASVIAGAVLEDGLRKLCQQTGTAFPPKTTIEPMNIALVKAGVYDTLLQKRITTLADIRNKAAHGKWDEFDEKDVEYMIDQVRLFMENCFGHV
jgi:hypothetical protein